MSTTIVTYHWSKKGLAFKSSQGLYISAYKLKFMFKEPLFFSCETLFLVKTFCRRIDELLTRRLGIKPGNCPTELGFFCLFWEVFGMKGCYHHIFPRRFSSVFNHIVPYVYDKLVRKNSDGASRCAEVLFYVI